VKPGSQVTEYGGKMGKPRNLLGRKVSVIKIPLFIYQSNRSNIL